jgi:nitrogenase molybdenum-iron protein beta chain
MSSIIQEAKFTCALGAQQTVLGIQGAVPVIHAGPGCSQRQFTYLANGSGYQGEGFAGGGQIPCTNASQTEVVFGGEKKLSTLLDSAFKVMKADLYVVMAGCTAGIVGDDVKQVASDHSSPAHPVVGVDTSGFRGNNYKGHNIVVEGIIDQLLEEAEPKVRRGLVNVFSVVPNQNPYWRGDLEEIKRILEGLGLEVNILFGYGSSGVSEWYDIPNAELNIVLSPWVGLGAAKLCQRRFGTPYLHWPVLPVGLKDTSEFLRKVAETLSLDPERTEGFILAEERRFKRYFVSLGDVFTDYAAYLPYDLYVIDDTAYGLGAARFCTRELGTIPQAFFVIDEPPQTAKDLVAENLTALDEAWKGKVLTEPDNAVIHGVIEQRIAVRQTKSLILGSSWDKDLAQATDNILIYHSAPITDAAIVNRTYVGYTGGLNLMQDIYTGVFDRHAVSNLTHGETSRERNTYRPAAGSNCN